jgi:hypothetical protein
MSDETIYKAARRSGMSRRDFVKFCTLAAAENPSCESSSSGRTPIRESKDWILSQARVTTSLEKTRRTGVTTLRITPGSDIKMFIPEWILFTTETGAIRNTTLWWRRAPTQS